MKPENPHPLSTGYAEAQRVGWQEGCDAGYKAGRQDKLTNQVVGFKMIDATPDGGYALRILRVYRQDCEVRWADTTSGEPVSNPMLVALNEMQEQRAVELDKAIALLERPRS